MQHVMIDLETLAGPPQAVFPTIGAVQFDLITGEVGAVFYRRIDIQDMLNRKMRVDAATLKWWMTQRPDVMRLMLDDPNTKAVRLSEAMGDFHEWFMKHDLVFPWANSPVFDLAILKNGLVLSNVQVPWNKSNERDYRTVLAMAPIDIPKPENAHTPVEDAKYQIRKLHIAYHQLNDNKNSKPVYRFDPDKVEKGAGDDYPVNP